jgi:hypothetical protein
LLFESARAQEVRMTRVFRLLLASACLLAAPALADEFTQDTRGAFLHGTYVLDTFGKALPLQLDGQWAGIRSFSERKYLFTFDAAAGFSGAFLGNSSERFWLVGGNARALGELGLRLTPQNGHSLYVGASALLNGSAISVLGLPPDQYNQKNSLDGIGGLNGIGALRLNAGLSGLEERHALLVTAFVGGSLRKPGSPASGPLYLDVGLRAQFDVVKSFTATLEGSWGTTFGHPDSLLGITNTGTRYEVVVMVRKMIGPIWLALDAQLHGTANSTTSTSVSNVYLTATPTFVSAGLALGVSL